MLKPWTPARARGTSTAQRERGQTGVNCTGQTGVNWENTSEGGSFGLQPFTTGFSQPPALETPRRAGHLLHTRTAARPC